MRAFDLEVHFAKWEFTARHHMTASDAESLSVGELLDLAGPDAREALETCWLGYTHSEGAPDLRAAIAQTYDTLSASNVQTFAGAEEAIYMAMHVLLDPDDHLIVAVPNYQSAETVPLHICEVSGVALLADEGWRLDLDAVRAAIRPNTRMISVNFPNNPTGAMATQEDFRELVTICRKHGLWLFSDEVYRGLELDETRRLPQAADIYEKALSLNVMSKAYGLPGLRIGWIATQDKEVLKRLLHYRHYLSICSSAPSERLAVAALGCADAILDRNRAIIRDNIRKLEGFFGEFPDLFRWAPPDGGCVCYPQYLCAEGVETFCREIVEEEGVLLLPSSIYRSELIEAPKGRFRLGCGRRSIDAGLDAMRRFLRKRRNKAA